MATSLDLLVPAHVRLSNRNEKIALFRRSVARLGHVIAQKLGVSSNSSPLEAIRADVSFCEHTP